MPAAEHPAWGEELARLSQTLSVIAQEKKVAESDRLAAEGSLSNARMYDPDALPIREMLYARAVQNERNLLAAEKKPYFTRIDFTERGGESRTYYIGKYGVLRSDDLESEVVDWRAPVANLYYSGQIGPLKYVSPEGEIEGELTLKRQFAIEESRLISLFDADIVAQDQYLQDVLSETTGDRLKEIVTTIQAEQNYVIRYPIDKDLVVQGVAGSGKTTIALHRIAYLLYAYQQRLRPENMLILAPNPLFLNFISQVLPDLGVENAVQTTFVRYISDYLEQDAPKLAPAATVSEMLSLDADELERRSRVLRAKGSIELLRRLDAYLDELEDRFPLEDDLRFGPALIYSADELRKFLLVDEKPFPLTRRLLELKKQLRLRVKSAAAQIGNWYKQECDRRILDLGKTALSKDERAERALKLQESLAQRLTQVKKQAQAFPDQVLKQFPRLDPAALYRAFWQEQLDGGATDVFAETARQVLGSREFEKEDLAPIAVIAHRVTERKRPDVRHIVIDEAQDFNALEIALLKRIARSATFTVVGDLMQGIAGYRGLASWDEVTKGVFEGRCQMHQLVTSYRNTMEIMNFASRVVRNLPVAGLTPAKPVLRHGEEPLLQTGGETEAVSLAETWHAAGMSSVAVVARSQDRLRRLSKKTGWPLLDPESDTYPSGVVLAAADAVKGLEFDAVILLDADETAYPARPLDARLLYVCLTRALHKMTVFHKGCVTPLLREPSAD